MPQVHVNSANGSPTSPYDTWEKAANTLAAAAAVAVAGDEVWVHPSHAETNGGTCTWAGTHAAPIKIITGTPDMSGAPNSVGITALQTGAQFTQTSASANFVGSCYVYGISFRSTGSTTLEIRLNNTPAHIQVYEYCELYSTNTACSFRIGPFTGSGEGMTTFKKCSVRNALTATTFGIHNGKVIWEDSDIVSGSPTPTSFCVFGSGSSTNSALVEINGFDFSNFANTFDLATDSTRNGYLRARNCKFPAGWGVEGATGTLTSADQRVGNRVELLNYSIGTGDTNYKFWVEDRHGKIKDETVIKATSGASDGTTAYSMKMTTLTNCGWPSSVLRSMPIVKRVAADTGVTKTVTVEICHDGASAFTDKDVWLELEYLGTSGAPLALFVSDRGSLFGAAVAQTSSSASWDGDTGTGPNGSTSWHTLKLHVTGITFEEEGYVIGTVHMAVPSKTLFVDPILTIS